MASLEPLMCRHPILSNATLNYREDCKYSAENRRRHADGICIVAHTLAGSRCLVRELVLEGRAAAICTVVAPWAMYRGTFQASGIPIQLPTGDIRIEQQIPLRTNEFEPPLKMQPAIVVTDPPPPFILGEEHGVDDIWHDAEITLERGAILTDHPWWETMIGESILKVVKAREGDNLAKGSYEVSTSPEQGFYFLMKVSPELFEQMHHPGSPEADAHVQSLYAAAFSEGLLQLRRDYKDPEMWRNYTNLRSLYAHLKENNLQTWDEGTEEDFRPNQIVAGLAPHKIFNSLERKPEQGEMHYD